MEPSEDISAVVDHLSTSNINFVAIDFDLTILDIHTRGAWQGEACELIDHIRPFFLNFIPTVLSRGGL